jgi:hypothetical protein
VGEILPTAWALEKDILIPNTKINHMPSYCTKNKTEKSSYSHGPQAEHNYLIKQSRLCVETKSYSFIQEVGKVRRVSHSISPIIKEKAI